MNYETWDDFTVSGNKNESVTVAQYQNSSYALVVNEGYDNYFNLHSAEIVLKDSEQVNKLVNRLKEIGKELTLHEKFRNCCKGCEEKQGN